MTTRRFDIDYDARVGTNGSDNMGAGACDHLPWGDAGTYLYQSLFKLVHNWDDMVEVTNVQLYLRTSTGYHISQGSAGNRQFRVQPVTTAWSPGSDSHPMTTGNAVVYGDVSVASSYEVGPFTISGTNSTWENFSATEAFRYFAPTTVKFPGGLYGLGHTNRGFRILRDASGDQGEFFSSNYAAGSAIYAVVTYSSHGSVTCAITDPSMYEYDSGSPGTYAVPENPWTGTATCPEGHSISTVQVQVSGLSTFITSLVDTSTGFTIVGSDWSKTISSASFPRGTLLYTRARATCSAGVVSAWTDTTQFYFTDATVPTISGSADQIMELSIEGTETNPCATVRWTFSDPQGMSQLKYRAILYADDGTTVLQDSGEVTSTDTYHRFSYASLSRTTFYKFTVQTWNSDIVSAGATSMARRKANWGLYTMYKSLGGTPTQWSQVSGISEPTNTRVNAQYSSSASSTPGTWTASFSDVGLNTYFHVRWWLFAWHGATTPSVNSFSLTFSTVTATTPDRWTLGTGASLSNTRYVLGSRSLRMPCSTGNTRKTYSNAFNVQPNTQYVLSGKAFSVGNSGGHVRVVDTTRATQYATTTPLTATTSDFQLVYSPAFTTGPSVTQVVAECVVTGNTNNECFFDCLQLEPGAVVSPYRPGAVGPASVIDIGGVQVDAYAGGAFRLRGSAGTPEAVTELGSLGLVGSTETFREVAAPTTPSSGQVHVYAKSDGRMYLKDDTGTEVSMSVVAHSALTGLTSGDDHTQYQKESEKDAASGYVGLDASSNAAVAGYFSVLGVREQVAMLAADVTKSTNTFGDITGLTLAVVNGREYAFEAWGMHAEAGTTTGVSLGVNHPGGTFYTWTEIYPGGAVSAVVNEFNAATDTNTGTSTCSSANVGRYWHMRGVYQCTADGTFALRYKRNGTSANVTIGKGSVLVMRSVP